MPDYDENFVHMRDAGKHAAQCLDLLETAIRPGLTTQAIDDIVVDYAKENNLVCAPLNYKGFPKSCCTSVNSVVVHGIPSDKVLKDGDIVKIDVTFINKAGYHGDSCRTYAVGIPAVKADRLMKVTKNALQLGIEQCYPNSTIGAIGKAIQEYVEGEGFSIVRDYVGHGIGQVFHEKPNVYHYYDVKRPDMHKILVPGMTFTVEPMVNIGKPGVKLKKDGWTVVTKDRSLSAQYEHTIGITETGCEIFTRSEQ